MEDLREAVLKLAAADKLRAQGFLRSEQNLPKTNKRGVTKAKKNNCFDGHSCSLYTAHECKLERNLLWPGPVLIFDCMGSTMNQQDV